MLEDQDEQAQVFPRKEGMGLPYRGLHVPRASFVVRC